MFFCHCFQYLSVQISPLELVEVFQVVPIGLLYQHDQGYFIGKQNRKHPGKIKSIIKPISGSSYHGNIKEIALGIWLCYDKPLG